MSDRELFYLVGGLGKTGQSIARYLKKRKKKFAIYDTRANLSVSSYQADFPEAEIFSGVLPERLYSKLTTLILSPGLSLDEAWIQKALQLNIPVYGDIECLAQEIKVPIIAITGTNGKSTVTTLVGDLAKAAGFQVAVCGNIGTPVLDLLDDENSYDLWVLELSSFQLESIFSLCPLAATVLNISDDHLDRHLTVENYQQIKHRIYKNAQYLIYNKDDPLTWPQNLIDNAVSQIAFGLAEPLEGDWGLIYRDQQSYLACGQNILCATADLKIKGKQNWANALAAVALVSVLKIPLPVQVQVLKNFAGLTHRCQYVRNLDQVIWINDSKGTNVGATMAALNGIGETIHGKILLIAGGVGKNADFTIMQPVVKKYVRSVILIGEDAKKIADALKDVVELVFAGSMADAIATARKLARPHDIVLLSPACASFDMFTDFNQRGDIFMQMVQEL